VLRQLVIGGASAALLAGAVAAPAVAAEGTSPVTTDTVTSVDADARAAAEAQRRAEARAAEKARRVAARKAARAKRIAAAKRLQRQARDMVGVERSLYRGRYYVKRHEPVRRCIVRRESNGLYRVVNRSSGAAGAYQFLPSTSNYVARQMGRRDLVGIPANRWNRLEQDKAFWTLWDHGRGRGHWAGGRFAC
jgi:hypothetical protein